MCTMILKSLTGSIDVVHFYIVVLEMPKKATFWPYF